MENHSKYILKVSNILVYTNPGSDFKIENHQ